jgi:hypothetical protein
MEKGDLSLRPIWWDGDDQKEIVVKGGIAKKRPPLLSDRQYRLGIANQTSGYYCPAQLSLTYHF